MNAKYMAVVLGSLLFAGCNEDSTGKATGGDALSGEWKWSNRNAEIYRHLFSAVEPPVANRISFITITPMSEWGETGLWSTIPVEELKHFRNASQYRAADEAYLQQGSVLERGTDAKAWMRWISVKRWISDTEVEVEEGVWCCPLGGGGSTTTYEKVDGSWQAKDSGEHWVS